MSPSHLRRVFPLFLALVLCASAPRAQQNSPFMDEFRKLMLIKADEEMAVLMRKNEATAVVAIVEICEVIGNGSSDQLEAEIDALGKVWKKVYGSKFVEIQYNFFSVDLRPEFKKHRRELIDRYIGLRKEFDGAEKAKDPSKLAPLGDTFNSMGDELGEVNDAYMAAQCYRTYAVCYEDTLNGDRADLRKACEGWGLFLQARESVDLKDSAYNAAKVRFETLVAGGYSTPEVEGEAGGEAGGVAPAAGAAATPFAGVFQLVSDIEAIQRPSYTADTNFQIWPTVELGKIDSSGKFAGEDLPLLVRTGANKAAVDVDGDGKGDVDIPLSGKITPVQVKLGKGGNQRDWAFLACIGQQQDTYQGFKFNLAPDENRMPIYVAPAGSLVGTINGVRVQVIDDNLDGYYGSEAKGWAYSGCRDGFFQQDVDSVVVGESKVAQPWSRLQKIGEAWFELVPNEAGTDILVTPAAVQSGTLQLDMKGLNAPWVLVRGVGEEKKDLVFDLVNGGTNKVEVPAGTYELFAGLVSSGKKAQMMKSLILPAKNARTYKVAAGATTKIELGTPFAIDFAFGQDDNAVTIDGPSLAVVGRGGETYQRMWNCVLAPEVNLRKAGQSKGRKEKRLVPVGSQEDLEVHKYDFKTAWFPIGEPIDKPMPGEKFEAQLFEKKNKLFGKIESDWKAN
ncbi:MAG: hypothetical protein EXS08_12475 [Planctomycetes bacterium]|nr:hypothetical protein [Planctomycetota bacterium]